MRFDLAEARAQLERTPDLIRALVGPLPESWQRATEGPGTWSPLQVVRHLLWGEVDDWIPRARLILEHQDRVTFAPFDRLAGEVKYSGWTAGALLDEFSRLRADNLRTLDEMALGVQHLALPGLHPGLGKVTMRNCWRPGWRTICHTSPRSPGPWRANIGSRSARGSSFCGS
jgi:hypothetical protein